jgi:hypothetical protein
MEYPNFISTSISKNDLNEILSAVGFIEEKLPDLLSLSDLEPYTMFKTKTDFVDFVYQNLKYAEKHPELVPNDVDIKEMRKDIELIKSLDKILDPLKKLIEKLEDSKIIASNEAYLPSIAIYNAIKANDIRKKHKSDNKVHA